jgi:hypothetical protein
MLQNFYMLLSLTMQATRDPCNLSFLVVYGVGTHESYIVNYVFGSIKGHDHLPSKASNSILTQGLDRDLDRL